LLGSKKKLKNRYKKKGLPQNRLLVWKRLATGLKVCTGLTLLAVISAFFVFGHDLLTQCDYFSARRIQIQGLHRLDREQICSQARIRPGVNIMHVNLGLTRKRLVAHPWIDEAEVRRELPDGIIIRITEHTPLALLDMGEKFLIDTNGEIFKRYSSSDPERLPSISGLTYFDLNVAGAPRSPAYSAVLDVLKLGMDLKSTVPNHLIEKIQVDPEMGLTLLAFDRTTVIKLGYDNYPDKYIRLKNVLCYLGRQSNLPDIRQIDLNNIDRIIVNTNMPGTNAHHKEV
jgi:cell division protein FtsQ